MDDATARAARPPENWEALLAAVPGATSLSRRGDGRWMAAPALDVIELAELMRRLKARLSAMTGLTLPTGETGILYHYCLGEIPINIRTETRGGAIPSIAPITQAADWGEREIADLYGVRFEGHPDPRRLIRPPALSAGFFREAGRGADPEQMPPSPSPDPTAA